MNRKQFAGVVAEAYASQYADNASERGSRVMNEPRIDYDRETRKFGWCSSLSPLGDSEVTVMTLSDGCFGNWSAKYRACRAAVRFYLLDSSYSDQWSEICEEITG